MAEFFILAPTYKHWMDDLTPTQIAEFTKQNDVFPRKYAARNQPGDILDVYPDGYFPANVVITGDRCVVKVPGLSYETAKEYANALEETVFTTDNEEIILIKRKRKWKTDFVAMTAAMRNRFMPGAIITVSAGNIANIRLTAKT